MDSSGRAHGSSSLPQHVTCRKPPWRRSRPCMPSRALGETCGERGRRGEGHPCPVHRGAKRRRFLTRAMRTRPRPVCSAGLSRVRSMVGTLYKYELQTTHALLYMKLGHPQACPQGTGFRLMGVYFHLHVPLLALVSASRSRSLELSRHMLAKACLPACLLCFPFLSECTVA